MTFEISIDSDLPKLGIFTSDMIRRQMPFATKQTLNSLAFGVKNNTVAKVWPRAFEQRNKRFAKQVYRVGLATKTRLRASVFDRLERGNLELHAVGGSKTPRGRHVAIPSRRLAARRSGKGVPKSLRPRTALDRPNVFKTNINGQDVIATRKGKRGTFEVLYILETRAKINKTFPFYTEASIYVDREAGPTFAREFEKASRTAKPRSTSR